ncbi:MAG: DNA cytosine methyltransferase [Lachnospiraceae bacterium]|nr:DNA cytosine methyltransferase [Lachnospiraceae bacterium]
MKTNGLNYIDLFAGAGGLSEGFIQSGYQSIAHIEMNAYAAKTIETRIAYYYLKKNNNLRKYYQYERGEITREELLALVPGEELRTVINEEMSPKTIKGIFQRIDTIMSEKEIQQIDVIIGGPPCQAYSLVGRAQSSHMIIPMEDDLRNELYKMYVKFLKKYQPRMFVFENVAGIKTARGGQAFKNLQKYMRKVGYEIDYHELNAQDFGVLQSRKRVIIVGWLKGTGYEYPTFETIHSSVEVWDLLKDLPALVPGESADNYTMCDMRKLRRYVKDNGIRTKSDVLTGHVARPHTAQDIEIYKRTIDLWFNNSQHQRLKYDDLPDGLKTHRNRTSFVDRFKVVEGDMDYCHTILAHLSKDGHYFIHPDIDQHRSITVREAARIQSFPDSYYFEGPRTSQFVQVGNAVPPMMAKIIADKIKEQLIKSKSRCANECC